VDRAQAVALIERRRDAWLREDVDAYLSLFHDEFAFFVNGVELVRGRLALENAVRRSYLRFRPVSWEFHEIAAHGPHVLTEWSATMEDRGTGARRSLRAMSICEMRDGLTTWQREYRVSVKQ
jgi:ketosteroid isomerase-like protein